MFEMPKCSNYRVKLLFSERPPGPVVTVFGRRNYIHKNTLYKQQKEDSHAPTKEIKYLRCSHRKSSTKIHPQNEENHPITAYYDQYDQSY